MDLLADLARPEIALAAPHVAASDEAVRPYLLRAARRFCRDSLAWRESVYEDVPASASVHLPAAAGAGASVRLAAKAGRAAFAPADFGAPQPAALALAPAFQEPSRLAMAVPLGARPASVSSPALRDDVANLFEAAGQARFELDAPPFAAVLDVWASTVEFFAYLSGRRLVVTLSGAAGTGRIWSVLDATLPDGSSAEPSWDAIGGELELGAWRPGERVAVIAAMEPADDATRLPAHFDRWRDAIVDRALHELFLGPGDWMDPSSAMLRLEAYRSKVGEAKAAIARRFAARPVQMPPHPFMRAR